MTPKMIPKFRAKDENGVWHTGLLTFMFGQYAIVNESDENTVYLIDKETVGQYTGLKDQQGVEIFEGDIIKNKRAGIGYIVFLIQEAGYVVVLPKRDYRLGHRNTGESYQLAVDHEVIGNIYENQDLLEVAK